MKIKDARAQGGKVMKRRTLALAAALTLAATVFVGCGSSDSADTTTDKSSAQTTEDTAGADTTETEAAEETAAESDAVYRTVDEIKDSGVIRIGVFSDKAPFGYVDENGEYQGYDVYFAERIAQDLGVEVEYTSLDPASRVESAKTGKVDIVLANFTVTPERAEQVDFALPYMKVQLGVVSPGSAPINSVEELQGKTLIVAKGTTAETYFEKNEPDVELQKYDQYADAYNALLDGRGDAFSTDNTEVLAWAQANPGFVVNITALGDVDTIAPAVAKGNKTLLNWLNEEIVALGEEQFFHADYAATLAEVYGETANPDDLVVEGGVIE